ncbi:hypothetical protein BDZ94DRAFT_153422 [Collybia nuda]|uniref:Extracellular membrane protein CFEM domain-containing protein n=1 Tax=Collybia nuda TaxID=64659 RepID=A0A9P5XYE7_9AGAR|nr:hypothetical protein BDZ94DRAFT_153422 [Collybia nuda]
MVAPSLFMAFVTALVASQQVLANPGPTTLPALLARQSNPIDKSQIPAQCQSSCGGAISGCSDSIDCVCTDQKMDEIASCFGCFTSVKDSGVDAKTAQAALDAFVDGCKAAGKPVKAATISTGNSGATPVGSGSSGLFAVVALGAVVFFA